ncbi:glycoside hydrolase family 2 TIM barrel-domain containing protein [Pedobacter psychrodurus]|uniref:glycoside hydrolase family 2 TIM barrel-domain containing protein n=1 Tax=Pedobacter psychrodurus TaxID=2530456 RepID=UPI00292F8B92|nr:glycoside hydrolase family 2 TIM barrel-domain containing protein [Pedobacter psychrodurus]
MTLNKIYSYNIRCKILLTLALISTTALQLLAQNSGIAATLSPIPSSLPNSNKPAISLNGDWKFAQSNKKGNIKVPGEWVMQGYTVNTGETAIYSREFSIPNAWTGNRIKLRFDGVSSHALVKVNGKKLAEHEGSFVPFEIDITDVLKTGNNVLEVEVQANTISDILACTSQYAVHTVGGILRNVTLFALPEVNLADLTVVTTLDKTYSNATLNLKALVNNQGQNAAAGQILYTLTDATGKSVTVVKTPIPAVSGQKSAVLNTDIPVKNAIKWNTDKPYLYTLTTSLIMDGKVTQTSTQKIGFRQVEVKANQVFVNGMPIKLRGVNRHSVHPLTGRSISDNLELKDAELFKQGNCNYIRTSHYPPSERFLAIADSIGLFVENESSLTWIQHGASPIWKLWNYKDEKFYPYMLAANIEKMQAGKNHASVIIWSLGNESYWSPLWDKVYREAKKLDPTRPISFHDQCWGGFNNGGNKVDIANYHYPGINGPAATDTMKRPTLFGEYAHLSTYNRRELITDPGVRASYGPVLVKMYDSMYVHKGNLGGAIWSGIDDTFHLPDGNIVGYGPWGPIDAWRRLKPEYWGMKKAYAPVVIKNVFQPSVKNGKLVLEIENRHDFISLKEVEINVKVDGVPIRLTSAIKAHGEGVLLVSVKETTKEVYISFKDPSGNVVNEELMVLKPVEEKINTNKVALSFTENEMAYFVVQGAVNYTINKITGVITGATNNGEKVLEQGPVFSVVPMNSEDGGKPNVAGETYQNNIYPIKNYPLYTIFANEIKVGQTADSITFNIKATYTNGEGNLTYTFSADGNTRVAYEVKTTLEKPYQYGMIFQLPKTFETLSWKRKGEFTVYAAEDIARDKGTAKLNAKWLPGVEEFGKPGARLWKDDANEMGSNDFRSTKQHILQAQLSDGNKGIVIQSNGKQASRSWLQDEKIQLLVADYWNNGSEPFYGSPFTDGRINIKGKTLKGSVNFRLQ